MTFPSKAVRAERTGPLGFRGFRTRRKRYRPEKIIAKVRQADVLLGQGKKASEVLKALGVSAVTYDRWRQEHGGLSVTQARKLQNLERENSRLRHAVVELALDKQIIVEASKGT